MEVDWSGSSYLPRPKQISFKKGCTRFPEEQHKRQYAKTTHVHESLIRIPLSAMSTYRSVNVHIVKMAISVSARSSTGQNTQNGYIQCLLRANNKIWGLTKFEYYTKTYTIHKIVTYKAYTLSLVLILELLVIYHIYIYIHTLHIYTHVYAYIYTYIYTYTYEDSGARSSHFRHG